MSFPQFILASASPARRQLLQAIGIEPMVQPSEFDEASIAIADPTSLVQALATGKAKVVAQTITLGSEPILVLGCDSVLVLDGEVHGKPGTEAEAIARWQSMRGHVGELLTGHALIDVNRDVTLVRCQSTRVHFADASDPEIRAYVATGEPMQCAGCFALDGRGGALIERIEGCHSNVIGLSLPLLRQMSGELGYDLAAVWLR
ncbi:MAG: septum formation inhibitor Maf [Synechococcales cyanobacterium RU_4_20]|nr:septum formation inhibitor Maf [Synechococcales cyanobacterium RU_4_20]NJR71160.1 septum formation inhibitor Maf [Synechococcales cyanobacterium CRU_2_2]